MPELTISAAAPLIAGVHLGNVVRDVDLTLLQDGLVAILLAGPEVGARLVGPIDTLHGLIIEADRALARLRGLQ